MASPSSPKSTAVSGAGSGGSISGFGAVLVPAGSRLLLFLFFFFFVLPMATVSSCFNYEWAGIDRDSAQISGDETIAATGNYDVGKKSNWKVKRDRSATMADRAMTHVLDD